jgi:hypothetical protein
LDEPLESPSDAPSLEDDPYRNPFRRDSQPRSSTDSLPPSLPDLPDSPKTDPENKLRDSEKEKEKEKEKGRESESESEKSTKAAPTSCDALRSQVKARTIEKVSLDISPPFRPDILDKEKQQRIRNDFLKRQKPREWRDIHGRPLGYGTFEDIQFEKVIISGANGQKQRLPLADLSEPDLVQIADGWGLPRQCRLEPEQYTGRTFVPATFTWKASGLCHNPLYFEEVALERYGHSLGPIAQPFVSTAHFFGNIAVLPYKMGIHPMKECQYALGYYRPGNCAPWIIPPVPLSLRGALAEAAVVGGGILLIP